MRTVFILLLFIVMAGCTRIPQPAPYAYTEQQKMQASHHWDVLASDVANQINNQLIQSDYIDKAVFVKNTCGSDAVPCERGQTTQFNEAFRDLLITRLVHFGVPTSIEKQVADIKVDYKVQVVYHAADRPTVAPGSLTALSTAILVFRNASINVQALAMAAGLDIISAASPRNGHHEVIITTSMVADGKYLFRNSDIYYINDPDFWHYRDNPTGKTIQMVSLN